MHPIHYSFSEFGKVLRAWYNGDTEKTDTFCYVKFVWISRTGSLLQFFAGLTIVVEIIGKAKVESYKRLFLRVSLKKISKNIKEYFTIGDDYDESRVIIFWVLPFAFLFYEVCLASHYNFIPSQQMSGTPFSLVLMIKNSIEFAFRNSPFASITGILFILSLFFGKKLKIIRKVILFPVMILQSLLELIYLVLVKIASLFIKFYFMLSTNQKNLKIFNFIAFLIGFLVSFIFS